MTIAPKTARDLALAPVAVEVDRNLQTLRTKTPSAIENDLALVLNAQAGADPDERADQILEFALRFVDRHGWEAEVTPDHSAIRLSGGSVSLDVALGAAVETFLAEGVR